MQLQEQVSLKKYNSFGVDVFARYFIEINTEQDLLDLFKDQTLSTLPRLVLGGGSNVLFTKDFNGLIIKINIKGITTVEQEQNYWVDAGAGEIWNDFVLHCVENGYCGLENLTLIPGSVGASPVQNIGAYGVELKDVFHSLRAFDTEDKHFKEFGKEDCGFAYRDSIFKSKHKNRYIITSVRFLLGKTPNLNTSYGAIEQELKNRSITQPTIKDISEVVAHIRVSKLPDPSTIGNAGSFFKNPLVSKELFSSIQIKFPEIVHYTAGENIKLAAGWMIEQCGFRGMVFGNTGTWKNQALVLVNHGGATGSEIFDFSERIIQSVNNKFGVTLEREVNIM